MSHGCHAPAAARSITTALPPKKSRGIGLRGIVLLLKIQTQQARPRRPQCAETTAKTNLHTKQAARLILKDVAHWRRTSMSAYDKVLQATPDLTALVVFLNGCRLLVAGECIEQINVGHAGPRAGVEALSRAL